MDYLEESYLMTDEEINDAQTLQIEEGIVEDAALAQFVAAGVAAGVAAFPKTAY